jgi:hypothetical protein
MASRRRPEPGTAVRIRAAGRLDSFPMGQLRRALPVKLIVGLLGQDADVLRRARQKLVRRFGQTDLESDLIAFEFTDYYAREMGENLLRWFLSFSNVIQPDQLAEIKEFTNRLEAELAEQLLADVPRPVNIDPGYIDLGKLVLATTKDRAHRICIGPRVYAEVTLQYVQGAWQPSPWTYPDYQTPRYQEFLTAARVQLKAQRDAFLRLPDAGSGAA